MTSRLRRRILVALALGVGGAVACLGGLMLFEKGLIFFPSPLQDSEWPLPEVAGMALEEVQLEAEDGQALHGVYASRQGPAGRPVLLFCHGNAGNLAHRFGYLPELTRFADVLLFDYRGYGRNSGSPSEEGLYLDAMAAWTWLTTARGVAPSRIVLLGRSLGGGPAAELATRVPAGGLILDSTFTSIPAMAQVAFPFVPRFLVRTKFDTSSKLERITCPVLVIHSQADEVIPFRMGQALFAAAREPKTFVELEAAGHNETLSRGGARYLAALEAFSVGCVPVPAEGGQ